nr:MAG TPA: hypothetical protein [Caudoviricetes sp.]
MVSTSSKMVRQVSTIDCGGRLIVVAWTGERWGTRVEAIGGKTAARWGEVGRHTRQVRSSQGKRRDHDYEACGTSQQQRCYPPPFEAQQRNHPRRRHLLDRIMLRGRRHARCRGGHLDPVGRDRGAVTRTAIPNSANARGKRRTHHVLRYAFHH